MRDEHQQSIGRVIARLREEQGWSQRELATWVGLDQSAVSRIEAGRRRVSARELQRFVDAFHVSADALLSGVAAVGIQAMDASQSEPPPLPSPAAPARQSLATPPDIEGLAEAAWPPPAHGFVGAAAMGSSDPASVAREHGDIAAGTYGDEYGASSSEDSVAPGRGDLRHRTLRMGLHASRDGLSEPRLTGLPREVPAVVRDWFELRRLAGGGQPALAWSTGHSAEGRPARFADPVQPAARGSLGGDVLYDRVARFWRSELHVQPDDGPLPDLVTLLEDGLGVQVIVARVAGLETDLVGTDRPVCAALTASGVPFLFVNAARPVVLQRFALAHAFAHLVLGHGDVVDDRIHWSRNNPREAAANDFAEETLAPVRAVERWYERRGEPRPELDTLLALGNAFGISAWAALYRSRAARRLHPKQFGKVNADLRRREWELLPEQAFLGGLRDTLTHLTPGECLPRGEYGPPEVLRVPALMRSRALAAVRDGRLSLEDAALLLQTGARELAAQLARFGLD